MAVFDGSLFSPTTRRQWSSSAWALLTRREWSGSTWELLSSPTTFYVRPDSESTYGQEGGANYDNAFNGFSGIDWDSITAGCTLYVCGTHCETLVVPKSGDSAESQIIISGNYATDPGIINGLATLDNNDFEAHSGDILKMPMPSVNVDQILYESGVPAPGEIGDTFFLAAPYPIAGTVLKYDGTDWLTFESDYFVRPAYFMVDGTLTRSCKHPKTSVELFDEFSTTPKPSNGNVGTATSLAQAVDDTWKDCELYWHCYMFGVRHSRVISSTGSTVTVRNSIAGESGHYSYFYIGNSFPTISVENEWAHKNDYLYFHTPGEKVIQYPSIPYGVFIARNQSYVRVTGLEIQHLYDCGVVCQSASYIEIDNNDIHDLHLTDYEYAGRLPGAIHTSYSSYINIHDNDVADIIGSGANGISARLSHHITAHNNTVTNIGLGSERRDSRAIGIVLMNGAAGGGNIITDNNVTNTNYSGIRNEGADVFIDGNYVDNVLLNLSDGGGIYMTGTDGGTISNNIVQNMRQISPDLYTLLYAVGIYLDLNCDDVTVEYNTVFGVNADMAWWSAPIFIGAHTGAANIIRYNDLYYDGTTYVVENGGSNTISDNNEYSESEYTEV